MGVMCDIHFVDTQAPPTSHTVVLAVKTPTLQHSGISHLAEHMSFRRSAHYPAAHELFATNALLPVSINATTLEERTFFFATSEHQSLLLNSLHYLYSGMLNHHYSQQEVACERDGVIFNELAMLEANSDYALNAGIRLGDTSTQAYQHAGGFTQTIGNIHYNALIAYKQKWYQPENITIFVCSESRPLFEKCKQIVADLNGEAARASIATETQSPLGSDSKPQSEQARRDEMSPVRHVFSWWFPSCFAHGLKMRENALQSQTASDDVVFIDPEVNRHGNVAIRFVTFENDPQKQAKIKQRITARLAELDITPANMTNNFDKLPPCVHRAIRYFQTSTLPLRADQDAKALYLARCNEVYHSLAGSLYPRDNSLIASFKNRQKLARSSPLDFPPSEEKIAQLGLLSSHRNMVSLDHLPLLPRLLQPLANETSELTLFRASAVNLHPRLNPAYGAAHWVWRVPLCQQSGLAAALASSRFWQPRTTGECYALGAASFEKNIYLFGANDINAPLRETWCEAILRNAF